MRGLTRYFISLCLLLSLAGCASTKIQKEHSMIANTGAAAEIFFIRPGSERPMGMGDDAIQIDIDDEPLLLLSKAQYIGVLIKPGNMDIMVRTMAPVGRQAAVKKLTRKERFSFLGGQRYYILMKMIDGEFRGLSYAPVKIDKEQAKTILGGLRPIGDQAKHLSLSM